MVRLPRPAVLVEVAGVLTAGGATARRARRRPCAQRPVLSSTSSRRTTLSIDHKCPSGELPTHLQAGSLRRVPKVREHERATTTAALASSRTFSSSADERAGRVVCRPSPCRRGLDCRTTRARPAAAAPTRPVAASVASTTTRLAAAAPAVRPGDVRRTASGLMPQSGEIGVEGTHGTGYRFMPCFTATQSRR